MGSASPLDNVRVVLVRPARGGNVGATARAMLNMGLRDLILVDPRIDEPDPVRWMAHRAEEVVSRARTVETLAEALATTTLAVATTARRRRWRSWPLLDPAEAAALLVPAAADAPVALVFGPEDKGLSNDDLGHCTHIARVPTDAAQPSLNLAQAVLLMSWELRRLARGHTSHPPRRARVPAPADQIEGAVQQLVEVMTRVGFMRGKNTLKVLTTARQVFKRTELTPEEVGFVRGSLRKIAWGLDQTIGPDEET